MGYIYLLTNKINGKQYVGQTIRDDINLRWNQYKQLKEESIGRCLFNAFTKYGIENFKFQIICICFNEDCNKYEMEYIKKYKTIIPNGYNLREGGNNSKHHPHTIILMSISMKEKMKLLINPNYGIIHTEEYKKKMSESVKKALTKRKLDGYKQHINSLENLNKNHEKNKKKIGQYSINNELIKIFNSIKEAETYTNIDNRRISESCNRKRISAGGFIWKIINE